ncbi:nicotinamidase-related amidase [Pedobacter duraquae]|uniref:Nicotinamidase-related amidase n=2 Tax=Pedobacter duraquae TaxID=425511 RepID=A0A4R6IE33_9SPHI|nr:nicotinamidase-related amidase [Pedobacter duraquae]
MLLMLLTGAASGFFFYWHQSVDLDNGPMGYMFLCAVLFFWSLRKAETSGYLHQHTINKFETQKTIKTMKKLIITSILAATTLCVFAQKPSPALLNPTNHTLIMVDYQSQMAFATGNITIESLRSNAALVAGASKIFNIPTVVTTVAAKSFSGPVFPEITEFFPQATSGFLDRTTMNSWEDANVYKAVTGKGKKTIVLGGLWTSVCIVGPALSAINEGYNVYFITDACGDVSKEAHEQAVTRMVQAGAHPITAMQYLLELQRDWARSETYKSTTDLVKKYGGAYGIGIQYGQEMIKH